MSRVHLRSIFYHNSTLSAILRRWPMISSATNHTSRTRRPVSSGSNAPSNLAPDTRYVPSQTHSWKSRLADCGKRWLWCHLSTRRQGSGLEPRLCGSLACQRRSRQPVNVPGGTRFPKPWHPAQGYCIWAWHSTSPSPASLAVVNRSTWTIYVNRYSPLSSWIPRRTAP
jgi:hypothetical protein